MDMKSLALDFDLRELEGTCSKQSPEQQGTSDYWSATSIYNRDSVKVLKHPLLKRKHGNTGITWHVHVTECGRQELEHRHSSDVDSHLQGT